MKLPEEKDDYGYDRRRSTPVVYAIAGVSLVVLIILGTVIAGNNVGRNVRPSPNPVSPNAAARETKAPVIQPSSDSQVRVDDLDFWDMYPPKDDSALISNDDVTPEEPVASPSPPPLDPSEDGRHTFVERRNGTSEWVQLNPFITRNTYDPLGFIKKRDRMGYYEQDRLITKFGVDLSDQNGTVDFYRLSNADVDFVMLRLGVRGYETGQLKVDVNFAENLDNALHYGLNVGIYFFSQATNSEEVTEEAVLVIESLAGKKISYPVVFQMDFIAFDSSRIDKLTRAQKTEIADTFCNYMSGAGYVPMIYGTKEWLIEHIDLAKLMNYDIWLSQSKDLPDYPYKYQIWQYSHSGSVAGVNGDVNMNVCFVDYTAR